MTEDAAHAGTGEVGSTGEDADRNPVGEGLADGDVATLLRLGDGVTQGQPGHRQPTSSPAVPSPLALPTECKLPCNTRRPSGRREVREEICDRAASRCPFKGCERSLR